MTTEAALQAQLNVVREAVNRLTAAATGEITSETQDSIELLIARNQASHATDGAQLNAAASRYTGAVTGVALTEFNNASDQLHREVDTLSRMTPSSADQSVHDAVQRVITAANAVNRQVSNDFMGELGSLRSTLLGDGDWAVPGYNEQASGAAVAASIEQLRGALGEAGLTGPQATVNGYERQPIDIDGIAAAAYGPANSESLNQALEFLGNPTASPLTPGDIAQLPGGRGDPILMGPAGQTGDGLDGAGGGFAAGGVPGTLTPDAQVDGSGSGFASPEIVPPGPPPEPAPEPAPAPPPPPAPVGYDGPG